MTKENNDNLLHTRPDLATIHYIRVKKQKAKERALKTRENKEKLINDILNDIKSDFPSYKDFVCELLKEFLMKKTQKEIKELFFNN